MHVRRLAHVVMDTTPVFADLSFALTASALHSGGICFVEGSLVAWKSKRQSIVTTSTAESGLVDAMGALLKEGVLRWC